MWRTLKKKAPENSLGFFISWIKLWILGQLGPCVADRGQLGPCTQKCTNKKPDSNLAIRSHEIWLVKSVSSAGLIAGSAQPTSKLWLLKVIVPSGTLLAQWNPFHRLTSLGREPFRIIIHTKSWYVTEVALGAVTHYSLFPKELRPVLPVFAGIIGEAGGCMSKRIQR
jgi:hypothetical protein